MMDRWQFSERSWRYQTSFSSLYQVGIAPQGKPLHLSLPCWLQYAFAEQPWLLPAPPLSAARSWPGACEEYKMIHRQVATAAKGRLLKFNFARMLGRWICTLAIVL